MPCYINRVESSWADLSSARFVTFIWHKWLKFQSWKSSHLWQTVDIQIIFQYVDNLLYSVRLEDPHKSEERRLLWSGFQLVAEKETGARRPPAVPGHADLPGRGWETAQTVRHQTIKMTIWTAVKQKQRGEIPLVLGPNQILSAISLYQGSLN